MPPKVDVDAWTTERVGPPEPERPAGGLQRFLDAWSGYNPPKSVQPGSIMIDRRHGHGKNAERYAIERHNLALKQGYESELVRYRHFRGPTFMVTVRPRGASSPSFMTDMLTPETLAMHESGGHFAAPRRSGALFASLKDKYRVEEPDYSRWRRR